jgi:DNA adenine methylase
MDGAVMGAIATKPALHYYGGKWDLAPWIIGYFPPHDHYVEPCFGAGSVLLQKPMVKMETVNDLNGQVVNYFKVLRDRPSELIRLLDLTPWAVDEYKACQIISGDPLEDARRFHVQCWMSIHGGPLPTGFRMQNSLSTRYSNPATDLINHDLQTIAGRLKNLQILNEDAIRMLRRYEKADDALIYFDPPYVLSTRSHQTGYAEFENDLHFAAAEILRRIPGYVVISGYACQQYTELYEDHGWHRIDRLTQTNSGGKRTESIWLSPRTWIAMQNHAGLPLFQEVR